MSVQAVVRRSELALLLVRGKFAVQMKIARKISYVTGIRRFAESHATQPLLTHLLILVKSGTSVYHKTGSVKKGRGTVTMTLSAKETSYVPMKCAQEIQDSPWPDRLALTLIVAVRHRHYQRLFHQPI